MGKNISTVSLCCLERPGATSSFKLTVTNTNGYASPVLRMLPALTESKAVEGQWAGPTAAPMRLFADKSDPALCAPNVRSPQYLVKVEKNSTVMINALCDDFNVVESACLNLLFTLIVAMAERNGSQKGSNSSPRGLFRW